MFIKQTIKNFSSCEETDLYLLISFQDREVGDPQFFLTFLTQVTHYLTAVKLKKNCRLKHFRGNVLKLKKFEQIL